MRRAYIGMIIGVVAAVIWHWLGWEALVWSIGLGLAGYFVGWILDNPAWLTGLARKARAPTRLGRVPGAPPVDCLPMMAAA